MYLYHTPIRVLASLFLLVLVVICVLGIVKSRRKMLEMQAANIDFEDEFLIMYRTNRILLIIISIISILRLLLVP